MASGTGRTLQSIRVQKELKALKQKADPYIVGFSKPVATKEAWIFKIKPDAPYNGVLSLMIDCTGEYPFRAPTATFTHPVYHPNVDKNGDVCISLLSYDNWKPATTLHSIVINVVMILADPDLGRPVRYELVDEYTHNRQQFNAKAAEITAKHSAPVAV